MFPLKIAIWGKQLTIPSIHAVGEIDKRKIDVMLSS